jgi:hypothetical protein
MTVIVIESRLPLVVIGTFGLAAAQRDHWSIRFTPTADYFRRASPQPFDCAICGVVRRRSNRYPTSRCHRHSHELFRFGGLLKPIIAVSIWDLKKLFCRGRSN